MRISGTEPSSVILSQTVKFKKLKSDDQKLPKQADAKRDGVINPQNYKIINIYRQNQYITFSRYTISKSIVTVSFQVVKYFLYNLQFSVKGVGLGTVYLLFYPSSR